MKTGRRNFIKAAGAAGAGMITGGVASGKSGGILPVDSPKDVGKTTFMTELFLDNHLIEVTPGVSRRLHQPRKYLLNPVVRCDRWSDGNNIQPYTTMYDKEEKLFKMWSRAGSDWGVPHIDGHAAYMTYLTSTDGLHWDKPN